MTCLPMRFVAVALVSALPLLAQSNAPAKTCVSTVTGNLEIVPFKSAVFGNERKLRVWLPPGYNDAANQKTTYSVLYIFDGQMLFDRCTAPGQLGEWQIDETLTDLIAKHEVEPIIVVGIDNAGDQREVEFNPYFNPLPYGPPKVNKGYLIPEFLTQDVLPYVSAHYRVKKGREHTGVGGSSLGGVAALTALIKRPDIFGVGLLESTSMQCGNGQLLRDVSPVLLGPVRVSVGVGTIELGPDAIWLGMPNFDAAFVEMNKTVAANFKAAMLNHPEVLLTVQQGAHHRSQAWGERFPVAIKFLYPPIKAGATAFMPPLKSSPLSESRPPSSLPESSSVSDSRSRGKSDGGS